MKKETIEFIIKLLDRELDAEYVQDNKEPLEIDYVKDLINASKDFISKYGEWYDNYYLKEKIEQLLGGE